MLGKRGAGYRWVRALARAAMWCVHRQRVAGLAYVPETGGALLVSNHQSMLDIPFIGVRIRRRVTFVARDTLRQSKIIAFVIHTCGGLTVRRGEGDRAAIEAMVAALRGGALVAIFPEGTRSPDGSVQGFQRGALLVARRAGVPVVPIGLAGTGQVWPKGRALPRPGRIALCVGAPLDAGGGDAAERAREAVVALVAEAEALRSSRRAD